LRSLLFCEMTTATPGGWKKHFDLGYL